MENHPAFIHKVDEKENDQEIHQEATDGETYTDYCAELTSMKPVKGLSFFPLYRHKDSWYISQTANEGLVGLRRYFEARPSDVLLASFPKCGTTWMKALIYATVNCRGQQSEREKAAKELTRLSSHDLVPFLELSIYRSPDGPSRFSRAPNPRLYATHIPAKTLPLSVALSGCRVVYVWRDPKDVFVSLLHFINRFLRKKASDAGAVLSNLQDDQISLQEGFELFCEGICMNGPYWDHVLGYQDFSRTASGNVLFCKYEDILADPAGSVKRLASFLRIPFTGKEEEDGVVESIVKLCSFEELKRVNQTGDFQLPGFSVDRRSYFRHGVVGDWVNHLTPEMARRIDNITEEMFGNSVGNNLACV